MENRALLVIDVQKAVVAESYERTGTITVINKLIRKAQNADIPVIYIQHEDPEGELKRGETGWEFHPDLEQPREQDTVIAKNLPNAFAHTKLKVTLEKLGINSLYICGAQTEYCVDSTCRGAFDLKYHVTLVTDAHTTNDSEAFTAEEIKQYVHQTLSNFWSADTHITLAPSTEIDFESR